MLILIRKWKLWYAHYQLQKAIDAEIEHRVAAGHISREIVPALERAAYDAEIDLRCAEYLRK